MADKNELKPCPCGQTPSGLGITDGSQGGKYHYVSGDCCGEWMIEFRANYKPLESAECMALAIAAWNAPPRAETKATPPADAALADEAIIDLVRDYGCSRGRADSSTYRYEAKQYEQEAAHASACFRVSCVLV